MNRTAKLLATFFSAASILVCCQPFDASQLESQIKDLTERVSALEKTVGSLNSDIEALQKIVLALQKNLSVVSVDENSNGYVIVFSNGTTAVISNGKDGERGPQGEKGDKGDAGSAPEIGVVLVDGVYYWSVDGKPLLDEGGRMIPVSGGSGASAPKIGVVLDGDVYYWTVNGEFLLDDNGNRVPATGPQGPQGDKGDKGDKGDAGSGSSDSLFSSVTVEDGVVTIVLKSGQSFVIPMIAPAGLRIEANKLHFSGRQTRIVHVALDNIAAATVTEKPEGWRVSLNGCAVSITAPSQDNYDAQQDGFVVILATSGTQTFIGKVYVTMEAPLFEMNINPEGDMLITKLDEDFVNPGFWAGIVEADSFDPEAIVAPAAEFVPSEAEGFYTTFEGDTYRTSISQYVSDPVPGRRYAAYCFPGTYSKWNGVNPNPYDVYVKYFTYAPVTLSVSSLTPMSAKINLAVSGVSSFYGGIEINYSGDDVSSMTGSFLEDAIPCLSGMGAGMYGKVINGYSGSLGMFVAPLDGDGKESERLIIPGAEYLIAVVPVDGNRQSSEYTSDDVVIKRVQLAAPQSTSANLVTVSKGASTTTQVAADFSVTSAVSKFFYVVVPQTELKASGLSEYDYVLRYGIKWDRNIVKATGNVGFDTYVNGLAPGTECRAIGVAFTAVGAYSLASMSVSSDEVILSDGFFRVNSYSKEVISQNSVHVEFAYENSDNIKTIRYFYVSDEEFQRDYSGSEDEAFSTLTAGSMWDYTTLSAGGKMDEYIYPEYKMYRLFAIGIDNEGKYTEMVKFPFSLE